MSCFVQYACKTVQYCAKQICNNVVRCNVHYAQTMDKTLYLTGMIDLSVQNPCKESNMQTADKTLYLIGRIDQSV